MSWHRLELTADKLVLSIPKLRHDVTKAVRIADGVLLLLTSKGDLIVVEEDNEHKVECVPNILDVCIFPRNKNELLVIDVSGKVFIVDLRSDEVVERVEQFRNDENHANHVAFQYCDSGESHVVLRDVQGRCYTWGRGPATAASFDAVNTCDDDIVFTKVAFLQDLRVASMGVGKDFNLALAQIQTVMDHKQNHGSREGSINNEHSCPLGLPILSETASTSHLSHEDVDVTDGNEDRKSSLVDSSNEDTNQSSDKNPCKMQRLSQSGLYLNPSEALNYLSSQLSWMHEDSSQKTTKDEGEGAENKDKRSATSNKEKLMTSYQPSRASRLVKGLTSTAVFRLVLNNSAKESLDEGPSDASLDQWESLGPIESANSSLSLPRRSSWSSAISRMSESTAMFSGQSARHKQLWFWGKGNRGQSGQGDKLDRVQPCLVPLGPCNERVLSFSSGRSHAIAASATGNVFVWGDDDGKEDCSSALLSPFLVSLPSRETASHVVASGNSSIVMCDSGHIYVLDNGDNKQRRAKLVHFDKDENEKSAPTKNPVIRKLLKIEGDESGLLAMAEDIQQNPDDYNVFSSFISDQKLFLRLLTNAGGILESLKNKSVFSNSDTFIQLNRALHRLIDFVNQSVIELFSTEPDLSSFNHIKIVREIDVFIKLIVEYYKTVSSCRVENNLHLDSADFSTLAPVICDLLQNNGRNNAKSTEDNVMEQLLEEPISWLSTLHSDLQNLRELRAVFSSDSRPPLDRALHVIKSGEKAVHQEKKSMLKTIDFWVHNETRFSSIKTPKMRILLDSRESNINVSSTNSFGKEWIVVTNDVIVLVGFSGFSLHPLKTTWMDGTAQTDSAKHQMKLTLPEETITLTARNAEEKHNTMTIIQRAILDLFNSQNQNGNLSNTSNHQLSLPLARRASYSFQRLPDLRGGSYEGSWLQGKMHGKGTLTHQSQVYSGHFKQNQKHGHGILKVTRSKGVSSTYEGEWQENRMVGRAHIVYDNGDVYDGQVADGVPEGQGTLQQGSFVGLGASLYVGEWKGGKREGYGVHDDIVRGDKYMGMWSADLKHGAGCGVTIDGIYYEGNFLHDKMSGKGLMLFEDDTAYEGEFADAGTFNGAGVLSYVNGDRLTGNFYGDYSSGLKFSGQISKSTRPLSSLSGLIQETALDRNRIGKLAVSPDLKWSDLFGAFCKQLGVPYEVVLGTDVGESVKSDLVWDHMAILINKAKNDAKATKLKGFSDGPIDNLERIPDYFSDTLDQDYLLNMDDYLNRAFENAMHPLGNLLKQLSDCFNATYGGVRVHPRLLKHAVNELDSIVRRLHAIVKVLFPAIAKEDNKEDEEQQELRAKISPAGLIHPHVLPRIHSSLFTLYALFFKRDDDEYWSRLVRWNRHSDLALLSFLGVDPKFWSLDEDSLDQNEKGGRGMSQIRDKHFLSAVETLQQLKTKFTPLDKLQVVTHTFREVNRIGMQLCGTDHVWCMDDLFPVFIYIIVRARILQLGAEIHLIEQLTHPHLLRGEFGIMLTTLQAGYYQIIKEAHFI